MESTIGARRQRTGLPLDRLTWAADLSRQAAIAPEAEAEYVDKRGMLS